MCRVEGEASLMASDLLPALGETRTQQTGLSRVPTQDVGCVVQIDPARLAEAFKQGERWQIIER